MQNQLTQLGANRKRQLTKKLQYSKIISSQEINTRYNCILKDLDTLLKKLSSNSLVLNYDASVVTAKPIDIIRVVSAWSQKDTFDLTIRNIILSSIMSSENRQAGSGIVCAYHLISDSEKADYSKRNTLKNRAESFDIDECLSYFLGGGVLFELMKELIHMGGISADLKFGYTSTNNFIINVSSSKEILGEIHPLFTHGIKEVENPIIIGVNGRIDSLGEIDHLLQASAKSKRNVVILAMGFAPDLVTTLDRNWKSGALNIVPYTVKQWDINGNLDAISICDTLGITCVSSESGGVFSAYSIDDFKDHRDVHITSRGILIKSDDGESLCAEIKIPKRMLALAGIIRDRCKLSQKICVGVARSGICSNDFKQSIYAKHSTKPVTSYASERIGIRAAESCKEMILNMGNLIISK